MRLFSAAALALVIPCCSFGQLAIPALSITKTHIGNFVQGQNGATYSVTVKNGDLVPLIAAMAPVTVTETVPTGLALMSMAGVGWTCPSGGTTCTRADALAAGASYPAITVTVNVATHATSPQVNAVSVVWAGFDSASATDSTTVNPGVAAPGQNYTIQTFAGGGLPQNVPGTSASLRSPSSVAVDGAGNVFFIDQNSVVLRLDATTGVLSVVAGNGAAGYTGDNGLATSAQLNSPTALALDAAGNLCIADTGNYRIRMVSNGVITTVAGNGTAGYSGDNGPATSAQLAGPQGVTVDSAGNLYIAEYSNGPGLAPPTNSRIRRVSNGVITTVAGNGTVGFSGDNGPATSAQLNDPDGVAVDSAGNLYIADSGNNRIRMVSNGFIITVVGSGTEGYSGDNGPAVSAELNNPWAVAVDAAGSLYIADSYNFRIRKVSNGVITTVAGNGTPGFGGDNGPASSAELSGAKGVALDSAGNLYIADSGNNRIRKVSNGMITTLAGGGSVVGDNGPATSAWLGSPEGVAVNAAGDLYIADNYNDRIRKVANGVITTVAGNGTQGYSGDNGPATSAQLYNAYGGVAVDAAGNLYIADYFNNRIRKVSNGVITTVAGTGASGFSGDNGPATSAALSNPGGVAVDAAGNLYIADYFNNRIRKVSNGVITTVAGDGQAAYSGDNGPATSAGLNSGAIAVDGTGNLYIADTLNQRIREVSNGVITTVAGIGTAGFSGDNGPATSSQLYSPRGVAVDSAGSLYIADTFNFRIRKVSNGVITTVAGGGSVFGDNGPATSALLSDPYGVAVDAAGNVYVADSANNRIRVLIPSGASCSAASVAPLALAPPASGGDFTITIQIGPSCSWAIQNLPGWITIPAGAVGSGPGSVMLIVALNSGVARAATITVAGVPVQVNQGSAPCSYALTAGSQTFAAAGGPGSISVITTSWCSWTSASAVSWVTLSSGASSGTGNGPILYQVAPNSGGARSGALTVAGLPFTVQQAGVIAVAMSIVTTSPLPQGAVGVAYSQALIASGGAPPYIWSVTAGALPSGLALGGASGTLSGTPATPGAYTFTAQVTDTASATASATFAVTISQSPACTYSIYPVGQAFPVTGGTGNITVNTLTGCPWTASGLPSWITVTSGASGTGNGTVTYQTTANTGDWRTGNFTLAGASFVVEQSSATLGSLTTVGSMPHVATAGGWQTSIMLVNLGTASAQARLSFFDDNGAVMLEPLCFPQAPLGGTFLAGQLERTIAPGAAVVIQTCGSGDIAESSWAQVQSNGNITGFARFGWASGGGVQEADVPLESRNPSAFVLYYDQTGGFATGVAVANVTGQSASVAVTVRDDTGTVIGSETLSLLAYGHRAYMVTDHYPATAQGRGTIEFDTPAGGQIATLAFRASTAGTLSTAPSMVK
jgi:sugar lactone lactonase YvrE